MMLHWHFINYHCIIRNTGSNDIFFEAISLNGGTRYIIDDIVLIDADNVRGSITGICSVGDTAARLLAAIHRVNRPYRMAVSSPYQQIFVKIIVGILRHCRLRKLLILHASVGILPFLKLRRGRLIGRRLAEILDTVIAA